ncbi:hypothetical protein AAG570_008193 [Ranatra chinensis]|uniref:Uncharacterized protein n=1 Tax=Ranatra chinensis TaxID=642074 RepID=A0ABD0XSG6_9HEMI
MAALKKSEFYSLVFDVVVNDKEALSDTRIELRTDDELYNKLVDWIEEQKILTEEKVQAYIDEQYADLEKRKAIAHRDHLAISRIILKKKKVPPKETPVKMNKRPLKEIQASYEQTSNSAQPSECSNPNRLSFDSEGLFTLDDIEDPPTSEFAEVHFSDGSESNDENVQVPRRDGAPGHYALSLPVPVPQFVHERQQNDSNSGSPNVPTDIEASMKKLAKSVHGDTVFGELPRPRFSTHL